MNKFRFLLLLLAVLAGCNKNDSPSEPTTELVLIKGNAVQYAVVCPETESAQAREVAKEICVTLDKLSGQTHSVLTASSGEGEYEIIVGAGAYQPAKKLYESFTYQQFIVKPLNRKLVVAAYDKDAYKSVASKLTKLFQSRYSGGDLVIPDVFLPKPDSPTVIGYIPPFISSYMPSFILQCGAYVYADVAMQVAYESMTSGDFDTYCSSLADRGYGKVNENKIGSCRYASYSDGKYLVAVSFYGTTKRLSIVSERAYATSMSSISGTPGTVQTLMMQTYQDNVEYTKLQPTGYVVRLSDGRFFIYDTGHGETAKQLMDYMRSRNVFTDGKVHIALIVISHPHDDHMNGLPILASTYSNEIICEAVAYNMVNHTRQSTWSVSTLKTRQTTIINAAKTLKANIYCLRAGQKFDLAGTTLEVLFTPDELGTFMLTGKDPTGKEASTDSDMNNSSNIVRLTVGGQKITFTGDCRGGEAKIFNQMVNPVFSSDIMTVAHHGFNVAATLEMYNQARPFTLFWPVRTDLQDKTRYFDQQLMAATYVKKHYFLDNLVEINLPYNISK